MRKKSQQQTRGQIRNEILGPARGLAEQLDMKSRVRCQILFGLVALLQFGCVCEKRSEQEHALMLQTKVENLIEKILQVIEDYYHQIRTELKCIPDEVPDAVIGTLKRAIDCVDQNERIYDRGNLTANAHKKAFLKCFSDAKTEVEETITAIDPNLDYCPENMTEKTYQINVTTTFTKTFHINIKNGLEVMKKKVNLGNQEQICVFHQGGHLPGTPKPADEPDSDFTHEDNSTAEENKIKDLSPEGHHGKGHESKGHHGKGHEFNGPPHNGHESKDYNGSGEDKENFPGIGHTLTSAHGGNEFSNAEQNAHRPVEQVSDDDDDASKAHPGKGLESKEHPENEHEAKEHPGKGRESKEHPSKGHEAKEHPGKGHEAKEHPGKGPESKEHPGKGHEAKEHPGKGHEAKEHPGKGHEPKEHLDKGHETKDRPGKDHELKEHPGKGHESKEHPGKDHQSKENHTENLLGISDSEDSYGGKDSSQGDDVSRGPGPEIFHDKNSGLNVPLKELPVYGGDSNNDDDDEYPDSDEYDGESDSFDADEGENEDASRPDWAQENEEESEAVGHRPGRPYDPNYEPKQHLGKGHESKESFDEGPQQADDYEGSEVSDYDNAYEDDDDDDEDVNSLQEGLQNNINSIADGFLIKNKTHEVGSGDAGTDHEKFFFPDTTPESKLTTQPPTERPPRDDYYADPDTEPEDSSYGNEYYDASEKEKNYAESPHKPLDQNLGQSKPAAPVVPRIHIKPKNQSRPKPSKPPQNSERHRITLPKSWPKKTQPRLPSQSMTALSQSFLESEF